MVLEKLFTDSKYSKYHSKNYFYLTPILAEYLDENSNFTKIAYLCSDSLGITPSIYISLGKDYSLFIELTYDEKQFTKDTPLQEVIDFVEECMKIYANERIEILIKEIKNSRGILKIYSKNNSSDFRWYLKLSQCYANELFHRGIYVDKGQIGYAPCEYTNYITFSEFISDNLLYDDDFSFDLSDL